MAEIQQVVNKVEAIGGLTLLASAVNIPCDAVAITNLTWQTGKDLSAYTPIVAVVKYNSGTLGIAVFHINVATEDVMNTVTMTNLNSTNNKMVFQLSGVDKSFSSDPAEFITAEITVASLAASSIDVYVYGIKI